MRLNPLFPFRLLVAGAAMLATACSQSPPRPLEGTMGSEPTKTECIGRFLWDIPKSATLGWGAEYNGFPLKTEELPPGTTLSEHVSAKANALAKEPNRDGGSMLVRRTDFGPGRSLLVGWEWTLSKSGYQTTYFHDLGNVRILVSSSKTLLEYLDETERFLRDELGPKLRYRDPAEIPTEPGFCLDHGFIADTSLEYETVEGSLSFPAPYDYVSMPFIAFPVNEPGEPLLDRAPKALLMMANLLGGASTLRSGNRTVNSMPGQEYLLRAKEEGKRSFNFTWQYPGKPSSLQHQNVAIDLFTADLRDEDNEVVDAPFADDKAALDFWVRMLEGFRLRPGAAGSRP